MRTPVVAGNWKMNGLAASLDALHTLADRHVDASVDVLICPPATLISACMNLPISVGGQDCHANASGAHTGDISAEMLADAGAKAVGAGFRPGGDAGGDCGRDADAGRTGAGRAQDGPATDLVAGSRGR